MFDDVVTASPAPAAGQADASPGTGWSSTELAELATRLATVDLDGSDAERVDQLTALEHVKAACAAAQARLTDRFVDSQARLAQHWHEQARACSEAADFDGWCTAREQARRHEFTPTSHTAPDPSNAADAAGASSDAGSDRRDGRDPGRASGGGSGRSRGRRGAAPRAGIAAQVALARHESPAKGTRLVSHALALARHLPHTLAALTNGLLNEHRAGLVARHTSHLSPDLAAAVDAHVIGAAGPAVASWGDRELERRVRSHADQLDPAAATARARTAKTDRRVTLRPVPDTMALLTAVLPVTQAVAVHAALARAAATALAAGDPRTRNQIMADTLVALVTGQHTATDIPIEIQVIITDRALFHGDDTPAHIPGYGPVPAAWIRHLLIPDPDDTIDHPTQHHPNEHEHPDPADPGDTDDPADPDQHDDAERVDATAAAEPVADRDDGEDSAPPGPDRFTPRVPPPRESRRARTWLRRLYTHPTTGTLVQLDSRRRLFDAGLRRYLITRDGTCRTPWCDAPIRHLDHIQPHAHGGPTTATNGQGLCVRCNLVKEQPGWHAHVTHPGPTTTDAASTDISTDTAPHTVELTTPTGHAYTSTAAPLLPGIDTGHQPSTPAAVIIELYPATHRHLEYHPTHRAS